jgi:hypothetical protein
MSKEPFYLTRDRMSVKVKLRTEKHGDDDVNAYDVMLYGAFANAVLLKLNPDLRPLLYTQEQADLLDGQTFNTLRFPELGSLDWTLAMSRMTLVIHDEQDEAESLTLTNRDADKFSFSLLPGGTVNLALRIKVGEIEDEDDLLKLLRASNQQLLVSLHQAAVVGALDNFEQAENLAEPMSDERKAAEKAFNPVGAQTPEEVVGDEQDEAEEEGA